MFEWRQRPSTGFDTHPPLESDCADRIRSCGPHASGGRSSAPLRPLQPKATWPGAHQSRSLRSEVRIEPGCNAAFRRRHNIRGRCDSSRSQWSGSNRPGSRRRSGRNRRNGRCNRRNGSGAGAAAAASRPNCRRTAQQPASIAVRPVCQTPHMSPLWPRAPRPPKSTSSYCHLRCGRRRYQIRWRGS